VKQTVERIGPFVPAFATAGASVCASFLILAPGPQTLGPPPIGPPRATEAGRIVATLSPPAQLLPGGRRPVAASSERRALASPARRPPTSTPASQHSSKPVSRIGAPAAPPPPAPSAPSAPSVTPPAPPTTRATASRTIKPGWGYGDRNHDHAGPPGRGSSGGKNHTKAAPAGPPVAASAEQSSVQNEGKKRSTGSPGRGSSGQKNQTKPDRPGPPVAVATPQHGPVQNGEKKSPGR
jgi:hypothetical protein